MNAPFRFDCYGMVDNIKDDKEKDRTYLTVLVGGVMAENFMLGYGRAERFQKGDEILVRGIITQQTFRQQVSRNFNVTELLTGADIRKNGGGGGELPPAASAAAKK